MLNGIFGGKHPDITPAQLVAIAGWIVAQLIAYGVLPKEYQQLAVSVGATALAIALKWADSHLRSSRVKAIASENVANAYSAPPQ